MLQGQGGGTLDKERKIGSAEALGMTVANGLAKRATWRQTKPYFHLDLNAGSGWNEIAGCPGSPLVFLELAQQKLTALPIYAWFCDINPVAIDKLEKCLIQYGHLPQQGVSLLCEDNQSVIGRYAEQIRRRDRPEHALGSLLCDPNAWFYRNREGVGVPVEEIFAFAEEFPKIDIILNVNYRLYGMQRGAGQVVLSPGEIRAMMNRMHWVVSRQHLGGNNRFWLAVARNLSTGDHKGLGLHHWDSAEGQYIMRIVTGDRQGELDFPKQQKPVAAAALPLFNQRKRGPLA